MRAQLKYLALILSFAGQFVRRTARDSPLIGLVERGRKLTPELVRQVYRGQVDLGMAPVQAAMLHMWQQPQGNAQLLGHGDSGRTSGDAPGQNGASLEAGGAVSPAEVLTMLQHFESSVQHQPSLAHLGTLTRVYIAELQTVLRTAPFVSFPIEATTREVLS